MRKLCLFIAMSLDGYIAKPNDNLDFLKTVEKEGEDYGYAQFIKKINTIIIGRKTYDYVVREIGENYYDNGNRDVYVLTRSTKPNSGRTTFYNGDVAELIKNLQHYEGKNLFCDGGAEVIHELLQQDLIDEMTISIIPILLGEGVRLFKDGRQEHSLELISSQRFDTGLVQLHYHRTK